ncbi:hypothetical protein FWD07_02865 [Candidatus Saccharibacteria bacterium]|nr:hypothetical protein [Candidatus Saccharibacteria bacterium]
MSDRLVIVANPGSSSRKYAIYRGEEVVASLHFEFEDGEIVCGLNGKSVEVGVKELGEVVGILHDVLVAEGVLKEGEEPDAVVVRMVAPGGYFAKDHIVDAEYVERLEVAKERAPLHAPNMAREIEYLAAAFKKSKVVSVSDSAFHAGKPDAANYYAIDKELADEFEIKRFGYHGLSVASVVESLEERGVLPEKLIVCHVGSGSSVTAVLNGKSVENTMGYSPLEGVMMATRAGSMDVAAGMAVKRALGLGSDEELEKYLNKSAGMLGVSGSTDDMRELIEAKSAGDERAELAFGMYVRKIKVAIGQMAAVIGGVDAIVFTATIGERSVVVRTAVMEGLGYLGVEVDEVANEGSAEVVSAKGSATTVYVVKTDEARQMVRQANRVLDQTS